MLQYQTIYMGVVMKSETEHGDFWLKCTSFSNDAEVTDALSRIAPCYVRRPLAINRRDRMIVTENYGGSITGLFEREREERELAAKDYARLQQSTIERIEELLKAGAPDWSPEQLIEGVESIVKHRFLTDKDTAEYPEIQCLQNNVEVLRKELRKLKQWKLPLTIVHNDLCFSNICQPAEKSGKRTNVLFFDWVDCSVSHPFTEDFALATNTVRDAYLEVWAESGKYGSMAELKECMKIARPVTELIMAARYLAEAETAEDLVRPELVTSSITSLGIYWVCLRDLGVFPGEISEP